MIVCIRLLTKPNHSACGFVVGMSAIRSLTFLVTLAMLSAVAWSRVGNCSIPLEEPVTLISPNGATVLNAFGRHGYIYSAFDGVVYPESFHVLINFTGAGERNKTYPTRRCSTPTGLLSTPWDTNAGRGLAAPLLNFYDASTFDCYPYRAKKSSEWGRNRWPLRSLQHSRFSGCRHLIFI